MDNKRMGNHRGLPLLAGIALVVMLLLLVAGCKEEEPVPVSGMPYMRVDQMLVRSELRNEGTFEGVIDLNGNQLDLDADADTSITADTDDQIDVEISGADEYVITASIFDFNGNQLDLDADNDTSVTADTDDQIDIELGGADLFVLNEWGASDIVTDTTEYLMEILDSSPVITGGTVSLAALNIDLGIGNSTGGTNTIYGLLIDGITQDAQNTETAIAIGNGWDRGLDLDGNSLYMDNDQDSYFSELADDSIGFTPGAATGSLEVRSGNLQVGDGSPDETHDGEDFYVEGISEFDGTMYPDGVINQDIDIENIGALPSIVSAAVITTTDGALWTVGASEIWFVQAVYCKVTTNFDCTGDDCTLIIGDGNDDNGFMDLADDELQAADAEFTGAPAGWHGMHTDSMGAYLSGLGPFVYDGTDTIDIAIEDSSDHSDPTAGAATCYIVYTRVQ